MKCLVTGGSGFIGSHLVERLLHHGHEVTVVDTRPPFQDVEWKNQDIREELTDLCMGMEFVFHLAALSNARRCGESPSVCVETNVTGTANLLDAARRAGVRRFVLASSAWVSGAQLGQEVTEDSPIDISRINTVYGASKFAQEALCIAFRQELGGPDYTIFRYGTPYGERMWRGLVVRAFLQMAEDTGTITILGDGKQTREFLYVGDLCEAHLLLDNDVSANRLYNLTGDVPISVESLATEVAKYYPVDIEYIPQARVEPRLAKICNDRAKKELGWSSTTAMEEGVQRCVHWWQTLSKEQKLERYWY